MDIVVVFDSGSIEIEGSEESLRQLARVIQEAENSATFPLLTPPASPEPFDGYARTLIIERRDGSLTVDRHGDQVSFRGPLDHLKTLANNFLSLADQSPNDGNQRGVHMHIEYYPDHPFLSQESVPIVVRKSKMPERRSGGRA